MLRSALAEASENQELWEAFSPRMLEITQSELFGWFKANYRECVEGFLSMILYLSLVMEERRTSLLDLASRAARELNPLALRVGQSTWPFFGLKDQLQLIWQAGRHAAPLLTDPWRLPPACPALPSVLQPFRPASGGYEHLGGLAAAWGWPGPSPAQDFSNNSVLRLARNLRPGAIMVDAGVFDGTDWSLMGILAGATVLGFEPLLENRRLVEQRLPPQLQEQGRSPAGTFSFLAVAPGEAVPRSPWLQVAPAGGRQRIGHSYIFTAGLGERVRAVNMTVRYDYSSIADQGYLTGPPNMEDEEVALTTLDDIIDSYLTDINAVDLLKLDVEGYEMGALRGAEWLLSEGRVHFLVMEFHPGMLGSSGTDPEGLLEFLRHYCFRCFSLKIAQTQTFSEFVARYVTPEATPLQGLGELEDLICENTAWTVS